MTRSADLLVEFLGILSHELRTPLSIISNDLDYLSMQPKTPDLSDSKQALQRIVSTLDALSLNVQDDRLISFALGEICASLPVSRAENGDFVTIIIKDTEQDSDKISTGFSLARFSLNTKSAPFRLIIAEMLLRLAGADFSQEGDEIRISLQHGDTKYSHSR